MLLHLPPAPALGGWSRPPRGPAGFLGRRRQGLWREPPAVCDFFYGSHLIQLATCIPVASGGSYRVGAWFEGASAGPVSDCRAWMQSHGSSNCIGPVLAFLDTSWVTAIPGAWNLSVSSGQMPAGTRAIRPFVPCTNNPTHFVVRVDDIFLLGPLFADGFETGDPGEWSAVEPPSP